LSAIGRSHLGNPGQVRNGWRLERIHPNEAPEKVTEDVGRSEERKRYLREDSVDHSKDEDRGLSRRAFIQDTGLAALALGTGTLAGIPTMAVAQSTEKAAGSAGGGPYM